MTRFIFIIFVQMIFFSTYAMEIKCDLKETAQRKIFTVNTNPPSQLIQENQLFYIENFCFHVIDLYCPQCPQSLKIIEPNSDPDFIKEALEDHFNGMDIICDSQNIIKYDRFIVNTEPPSYMIKKGRLFYIGYFRFPKIIMYWPPRNGKTLHTSVQMLSGFDVETILQILQISFGESISITSENVEAKQEDRQYEKTDYDYSF